MPWGVAAAAIGAAGSVYSSKQNKKAAQAGQSQTQEIDPRIASILFGENDKGGLLNRFQGYLNEPGSAAGQYLGDLSGNYIRSSAAEDFQKLREANDRLLQGNRAPTIGAAQADAAQINAPGQNNLNLSPAYQNFIYGNAAENPYLRNALQSGINQSNQAFQTQLGDITQNLQRNVLPGIRGNAIASGQFGSSRQGIAEGNALSDFTRQSTNAAQQLGLANIAATTGAQANAFSQGQDRSLNALNTLSGQQYNTALTQAQLNQQAAQQNADRRQAADNTNVNAGLQTQAQNNASNIAGQAGLSNFLGQANQYNQNAYNYGINRAQQVSGLLSPYIGLGGTTTSQQPYYQNSAGNAVGGAAAGLGLFNSLSGLFSGSSGGQTGASNTNPWTFGS